VGDYRRKPNAFKRTSLMAISDIERLGLNPIEMLAEVYNLALKGYKEGRGISEKADNGAAWLAVARQAADNLASYKYPKLAAMAVKDMTDPANEAKPLTTAEAVKVLEQDPFKTVSDAQVIDGMQSNIQTPMLPGGKK
jgi:hypothetical protein